MTVQNAKIVDALTTIRLTVENAKLAEDVAGDRAALQVLDQISTRTNGIALAIERLERDLTIEEYSAVCEQISAMYRTLGDLQAVAATAGTRAGGYKGAKSTNAIRSVSNEKRLHIKADFERASVSGTAKEEIYRILARRHRVSDRTVRRVISNRR